MFRALLAHHQGVQSCTVQDNCPNLLLFPVFRNVASSSVFEYRDRYVHWK